MNKENEYYRLAKEASLETETNPGLSSIKKIVLKSKNILDVGCGEGTKLNNIVGNNKVSYGIDISKFAIIKAKQQYPKHNFKIYDGVKIPFKDKTFDLVYSTFVLEHTDNPEGFIDEMLRVTEADGYLAILCPNYGAPNRRSPVSKENPFKKLISGFILDLIGSRDGIGFTKVTPKKIFKNIDDDTTCEPYLWNLLKYLRHKKYIKVEQTSSLWEIDDNAVSLHQRLFKMLGQKGIFPFKYWGPQLFIVIKKLSN